MTRLAIEQIAVVIPVHNEALHLAACLRAVMAARDRLQRDLSAPQVQVVVVLDRCTDGSAGIAARFGAVQSVPADAATVGRARAIGVERVLGDRPERVWVACTDADSMVPPGWLVRHWAAARSGTDLLLGTVRPALRLERLDPVRYAIWAAGYVSRFGHPHVHGANLGTRGDAYLEAGGFPSLACSEDHALWNALGRTGRPMLSTRDLWVTTSGRRTGRAAGGFADTLAALDRATASDL